MPRLSPHPPEPVVAPVMLQTWVHLTFLHWSYSPSVFRGMLPKGLEIETFKGRAWVGLVPFIVKRLRAPLLPPLPWVSSFPETNVRTYVRGPGGKPGVWFFSLDAARLPAVVAARLTFGLPYMWSRMRVIDDGRKFSYISRRAGPDAADASARIKIEVGRKYGPGELKDLDIFLTARFRLYSTLFGRLAYAQVEHQPYPLMRAKVLQLEQTLIEAAGLPSPEGDPLVHYSPGVDVRVSAPGFAATRKRR